MVVTLGLALDPNVGLYRLLRPAVIDGEVPTTLRVLDAHNVTPIEVVRFVAGRVSVLERLDGPLLIVLADVGLVPGEEGLGIAATQGGLRPEVRLEPERGRGPLQYVL